MQAARSRLLPPLRQAVQVMPGCVMAAASLPPGSAAAPGSREVFERFVELLYRRRRVRQAFECCVVSTGYVDHSPARHTGRAQSLRHLQRRMADPALQLELLHTTFDGQVGMVHLRVHEADGVTRERVEIYRLSGGRITEHWSVAA